MEVHMHVRGAYTISLSARGNSPVSSPAAPTVFTMSLDFVTFVFPSQNFNAALVLTDSVGASVEDCSLALTAEDLGV